MIKCILKILDSLLSSETMQSFSEIIILFEKFPLSKKYALIQIYIHKRSDSKNYSKNTDESLDECRRM